MIDFTGKSLDTPPFTRTKRRYPNPSVQHRAGFPEAVILALSAVMAAGSSSAAAQSPPAAGDTVDAFIAA